MVNIHRYHDLDIDASVDVGSDIHMDIDVETDNHVDVESVDNDARVDTILILTESYVAILIMILILIFSVYFYLRIYIIF